DVDRPHLPGRIIKPIELPAIAAGIEEVGIERVVRDIAALAAGSRKTILSAEHIDVLPALAGDADGGVVLLAAAREIREVVADRYAVDLRGRIFFLGPRIAAVDADVRAADIGLDHALVVVRRDPEVVIVAVRH